MCVCFNVYSGVTQWISSENSYVMHCIFRAVTFYTGMVLIEPQNRSLMLLITKFFLGKQKFPKALTKSDAYCYVLFVSIHVIWHSTYYLRVFNETESV